MPFGFIFAGLVIGGLFPWYGVNCATAPGNAGWIVGAAWAITGLMIGFGLLTSRRWFRAAGLAASALLIAEGLRQVLYRGEVIDHVLVVAGIAAFICLALPATGRAAVPAGTDVAARRGLASAVIAVIGVAGLAAQVAVGAMGSLSPEAAVPRGRQSSVDERPISPPGGATSLAALGATAKPPDSRPNNGTAPESPGIEWASFSKGLAEARSRQTPMFVEFYATWCGACRSMDRNAFRDAGVARKLKEMVAVRINAEEQMARDGMKGVELAERFQVEAYPTLLVLDSKGKELARLVGAPDARGFLRWLENATAAGSRASGDSWRDGVRVARK